MMAKNKNYEQYEQYVKQIADHFYNAIQENNVPWEKEWSAQELQENSAHNPITKTVYQGMNTLTLDVIRMGKNYSSNAWITFKQAKDLGGFVRKGEKSTPISFFKMNITEEEKVVEDKKGEKRIEKEEKKRPIFRKSFVFNLDQIDGLSNETIKELKGIIKEEINLTREFATNEQCEKILKNSKIPIIHTHNSNFAYYVPSTDKIHLPQKEQFKSEGAYYSTALHELGHATGHKSRLNRTFGRDRKSPDYAKEELRAELYSYLQAKELGIDFNLQNHQSYVKSWSRNLENKKEEIVMAVKDAIKIVSYVKDNYLTKERKQTLEQQKEIAKKAQLKVNSAQINKLEITR